MGNKRSLISHTRRHAGPHSDAEETRQVASEDCLHNSMENLFLITTVIKALAIDVDLGQGPGAGWDLFRRRETI